MKCPKCGGTGEMQICEMGFIGKDECDKCHGKGYLNNEEWLRQCTTEQLAEFLTKFILDDKRFRMTMVGGVEETKMWLKQPHMPKE